MIIVVDVNLTPISEYLFIIYQWLTLDDYLIDAVDDCFSSIDYYYFRVSVVDICGHNYYICVQIILLHILVAFDHQLQLINLYCQEGTHTLLSFTLFLNLITSVDELPVSNKQWLEGLCIMCVIISINYSMSCRTNVKLPPSFDVVRRRRRQTQRISTYWRSHQQKHRIMDEFWVTKQLTE